MWKYQQTDELYHYGVLGMKWGRRKNPFINSISNFKKRIRLMNRNHSTIKKINKNDKFASNKPVQNKPVQNKPVQNKPVQNKPVQNKQKKESIAKKFIKTTFNEVVKPAAINAGKDVLSNYLKKVGNNLLNKEAPNPYENLKKEVNRMKLEDEYMHLKEKRKSRL